MGYWARIVRHERLEPLEHRLESDRPGCQKHFVKTVPGAVSDYSLRVHLVLVYSPCQHQTENDRYQTYLKLVTQIDHDGRLTTERTLAGMTEVPSCYLYSHRDDVRSFS